MFFKLTHRKETHIYNPKENPSLSALRSYVQSAFKSLPQTFQFSYLDDQNDQITLSNQQDFKIMRQTSNKVVKIFIKESQFEFFDQTAKVQLDDQVQKLAEEVSSKQTQQKEEFVHIVEEPKAPEQKEQKIVPEKEFPNQIQVAQAKIQSKLKQLMPQLIEKIKQEIVKQSSIRGSVKSQVKSEISVEKEKIIHKVTCQECGIKDFEGIRYKCPVCEEFNLCQKCETTSEHPHPFLKIKHPKQAQIRIRGEYNNQKHNFLEFNGHKSPIDKIPFVRDIKNMAQGFLGMGRKPEIKEGFKDRKMWGKQCPYYKEFNQFAGWKQESHAQNLNQNEKKPESKKEEKKVEQQDQGLSRIMKNAQYLAEILGIDFNRCMKFAQKNPTLSQQQLLELYFENTNQLA